MHHHMQIPSVGHLVVYDDPSHHITFKPTGDLNSLGLNKPLSVRFPLLTIRIPGPFIFLWVSFSSADEPLMKTLKESTITRLISFELLNSN